jgi:Mlc titration factor MtfA (ptsG expression regulator)
LIFYLVARPLRSYTDSLLKRGLSKKAKQLLAENEFIYHEILSRHNPYYRSLSPDLREVFLFRVAAFMSAKKFRYHSLDHEERIPVLVSGAAVQMTFGMKNFLMDYFPVIHIIKQEYNIPEDKDTYYGHVSKKGIHVAWNHFIEGFTDYEDGINVGLHEMAHAVSFDVFLGESDHQDYHTRRKLAAFAERGLPVFYAMRKGHVHVLDPYATTNFDEFWAVCVEHFFEEPQLFREHDPELYLSVCELLNQDTLTVDKVINKGLAGIK